MADLIAAGNAVLDEMFGKLPDDKRAAAQALWKDPAAAPAIEELGRAALRRQDHSRQLDAVAQERARLKAVEDQQVKWWNESQAAVEVGKKALAAGFDPASTTHADLTREWPKDVPKLEDVRKEINEREQGALAFIAHTNKLAFDHFRTFGEPLDIAALASDPRAKDIGLLGVYNARLADQLAQKAKEAEDKRIGALVDARLTEERKKFIRPPDSFTGAPQLGSPLDVLEATPGGKPGLVDEAVAMYEELAAKRRA